MGSWLRWWGVGVVLFGSAAGAVSVTPLDDAPARAPEFISVAALGDEALVTWNSVGPMPFSLYWTILDATGAPTKPADAGALGEFSFFPPHVAAAPDAGLWLVVHPDKSGGGVTGGARISPTAGSLDGYGFTIDNTVTYTDRVRAAWYGGQWWVVFRNSSGTSATTVSASGAASAPIGLVNVGTQPFELAATDAYVFLAWPGDGGWPTIERQQGASVRRELPDVSDAVAVAARPGVVLLAWSSAAGIRVNRFDESLSSLDGAPLTLDVGEVATPRVSADDTSFLVVWARDAGAGSADLRLARVSFAGVPAGTATLRTGPLRLPDVAGSATGPPFVAWLEWVNNGWLPFAQRVGVVALPDAGAGDAGPPPDAGALDAGAGDAGDADAGLSDAGWNGDAGLADAGGADAGDADADQRDGGSGAPARYSVGFGCAAAPVDVFVACGLLLLSRRRGRQRG